MFVFCENFTLYRNKEQFLILPKIFLHAELWSKSSNDQRTFTKALSFIFKQIESCCYLTVSESPSSETLPIFPHLFQIFMAFLIRQLHAAPSLFPFWNQISNEINQAWDYFTYQSFLYFISFLNKQQVIFFFFLSRNI